MLIETPFQRTINRKWPVGYHLYTHLLTEVRAAEAVQEEVDHIVAGGDNVGDLGGQEVGQLVGWGAGNLRVLGVLVETVRDGVRETETDECHADRHEHDGQLALWWSAWSGRLPARDSPHVR